MARAAPDANSFNPWRRAGRSRLGWPGLVSVATHIGLGLLVMNAVVRVPRLAPLIRVSFIDPAPPPPAGSGSAAASAPAQAPAIVAPPEPVLEHSVETAPLKPKPVPVVHRPMKPAAVKPAPVAPAPAASAPPAVASGVPGELNGVPGGVPGGLAGGIVGAAGHQLVSAEQAARQPILMKKVIPEYPPMARMRGIEGQVVLEAILSAAGDVEPDIKVVQSVPLLDAAAVAAVRQWRFRPARDHDGEPLRVTLRVPVRFVLR